MFRCGEILKRSVETVAMYNIELITGRLSCLFHAIFIQIRDIEIIRLIQ